MERPDIESIESQCGHAWNAIYTLDDPDPHEILLMKLIGQDIPKLLAYIKHLEQSLEGQKQFYAELQEMYWNMTE